MAAIAKCPVTGHVASSEAAAASATPAAGTKASRSSSKTGNPINVRSMTTGADGEVRDMTLEERRKFIHHRKLDKPLYYGEKLSPLLCVALLSAAEANPPFQVDWLATLV